MKCRLLTAILPPETQRRRQPSQTKIKTKNISFFKDDHAQATRTRKNLAHVDTRTLQTPFPFHFDILPF